VKTNKKRVLVVDDETAIVDGVTMLLDFEAVETAGALDREAAMTIMNDVQYPVIVTDLCLNTVEEGLLLIDDVLRLNPLCRVLVLSGYLTTEMEEDLLHRGVAAVFRKPAASEELVAAVLELLACIEEEATETEDLETLYLTVRRRLYDIPRRRFGLSHDRAEDVLQEAWILFLQKRGGIRAAGPWLAGAVANLSRQQIDRGYRKRETFEGNEVLDLFVDDKASDLDDVLSVREALARLDERGQMLCTMIAIEGLSYEDVSLATGLPLGSVGPLYIRAKKKLKATLSH
jgi:RNA polymerase sigma factor (sigma-70 family)